MQEKPTRHIPPGENLISALRGWMMAALTLIFTLLYGAALIGWLKPLTDDKMVARLEPIIFVIIGYYFGRLPAQQNEQTLKGELNRQTQRADAAQHAKEQTQQAREALEEKIKNVRAVLTPSALGSATRNVANHAAPAGSPASDESLRQPVAAALSILNA